MNRIDWLLENLLDSETLTEWEDDFVNSVAGQYERKGTLSQGQVEKLEEIYRKDNVRK